MCFCHDAPDIIAIAVMYLLGLKVTIARQWIGDKVYQLLGPDKGDILIGQDLKGLQGLDI